MENALHQQRLLLYGGKRSDDQMLTQEWNVFNLATSNWELKRTTPAPTTPRWYVGCDTVLVNFDCSPNCLKAVFYSGWDINKNGVDQTLVWYLDWGSLTWRNFAIINGAPLARGDFMMTTADPGNNRFYVWGGKSGTTYYTNPAWIELYRNCNLFGCSGPLAYYHNSVDAVDTPGARAGASVAIALHPETGRSGWVMYGGYSLDSEQTVDNFYNMQVNTDINQFTWVQFAKGGVWPPTTRNAPFVCAGFDATQSYTRCKQTPGVQTRYALFPLFSQNTNYWRVTATF